MSDSESEEETFLVYADLKNQILNEHITDPKAVIKIIGVETQTPVIEINGNFFQGTYDYAMGTNVFFDKDNEAEPVDPLYEATCKQKYKFFGKTEKIINFSRINLEPKKENTETAGTTKNTENTENTKETPGTSTENADQSIDDESVKLNITYEEAVKLFPPSYAR